MEKNAEVKKELVVSKRTVSIDDLVIEFASTMNLGMKAIQAAAETYVLALTKFPAKAQRTFESKFPRIRKDTWALLEDIGRGRLPPETMTMLPGAVDKMRDAKLPQRLFRKLVNSYITVYNPATDKEVEVPFTHLTANQTDLVLNPVTHKVRTVIQQKRFVQRMVREQAKKERHWGKDEEVVKSVSKDYEFVEDGILVRRLTRLSLTELKTIVSRLEGATVLNIIASVQK